MCGRGVDRHGVCPYDEPLVSIDGVPVEFTPRYNLKPTEPIRILRELQDGRRRHEYARWGLIADGTPATAEGMPAVKISPFNARSESLARTWPFRELVTTQRCLVLLDGFYEWTGPKKARVAHFVQRSDAGVLAIAGLWARWWPRGGIGSPIISCTMLTRPPGPFLAQLHHREPAFLSEDRYTAWLDRDNEGWRDVLDGAEAPALEEYAVTRYLSKPNAEGRYCLTRA